jgi:hypothetical protein
MRKWVARSAAAVRTAAVGAGAAVLLAAVAATGSAGPATAAPQPAAPVQLSPSALPPELVAAIRRDLRMSPKEYLDRAAKAQQLAAYARRFHAQHPTEYAGAWIAADGKPTIAVTNPSAAEVVAADGYSTKMAAVSADGLDNALTGLRNWVTSLPPALANQIGSLGVDLLNNQLVLTIANTPVGQVLDLPTLIAKVEVVLAPGGGGPIIPHPMGGDTYLSAPRTLDLPQQVITVCSFGFNAVDAHGQALSISAGHCDPNLDGPGHSAPVYVPNIHDLAHSPQAGSFARSSLGTASGLDYSLIALNPRAVRAGMDQPRVRGAYGTTVTLTGTADPVVGAPVCKSGQTSAFTCGFVTADDVETQLMTDDGKNRTVRGFSTNTCTLSGDSGGPIITGTLALGITSGSNSSSAPDCDSARLGLALDGGTASLGIPINRIVADASATSAGGLGAGLHLRIAH